MRGRVVHRLSGSRRDSRGQALVIGVLMISALLSFAGLVIDVGVSYVQYRQAQAAADAAAIAGADNMPGGSSAPTATQISQAIDDARALAATVNKPSNGFSDGVNNTTVTIDAPYTGGPPICSTNPYSCVQVTITRKVDTNFLKIIGKNYISVSRSAVAMTQTTVGYPCSICVLNPSVAGALTDKGNGNITVSNGNIVVNSTAADGITLGPNGAINAGGGGTIGVVGGTNGKGTANPAIKTGVPPVLDPLASVPYPSLSGYASCSDVSLSGNSGQSILPGCYHDISVSGNGSLTFAAGLYVITGTVKLSGHGGGGFEGTAGVTFFFTCGSSTPRLCAAGGESGGNLSISGNGSFSITGPSSGTLQGMAIFYDRLNTGGLSIVGNGGNHVLGTIYAKDTTLNITGNGGTLDDNSMIVVDQLSMVGNAGITDNFSKSLNYPNPQIVGASKLVQ
jgi:hypothetical protein